MMGGDVMGDKRELKAAKKAANAAWQASAAAERAKQLAEERTAAAQRAEEAASTADRLAKEAWEAAWAWLESAVGARTSADEVAADGGPTVSDLRGEVDHG